MRGAMLLERPVTSEISYFPEFLWQDIPPGERSF